MKRSSTSGKAKATPTKQLAALTLAKLAKAQGRTPAEIELDAAKTFAKANAAEAERLRQELAATVQEAAADTAALAQQVEAARMWTRYERRKRQQAEQVLGRQLVQAVAAAAAQPDNAADWLTIDELARDRHCSKRTAERNWQAWGYEQRSNGSAKQAHKYYRLRKPGP